MRNMEHESNGLKYATGFLKTIILYEKKWAILAKTKPARDMRIWKHNLKANVRRTDQHPLLENLEMDEEAERRKIKKHHHTYPTRHHKNTALHVEKIFRYINKEFLSINETGHFNNYGFLDWRLVRLSHIPPVNVNSSYERNQSTQHITSVIMHTLITSVQIQSCMRIKPTISDTPAWYSCIKEQNRTVLNRYVIEIRYSCCRPSNDLVKFVTKLHK